MRRSVGKFRLAAASEFAPHCLAMAGAVGAVLMILVFAFFITTLIVMIMPNPLLISYMSMIPNVISLIISLAILGVLALICAKL